MNDLTQNRYIYYLPFLMAAFVIILLTSNFFAPRIISIFSFNVPGGTLLFPLSYVLAGMITEVYGFKRTRLAIWWALFFNTLFLVYGLLIVNLPDPDFETNNYMYSVLHAPSWRIIAASFISYLLSELINAFILAKIKMRGNRMWIRFIISGLVASVPGAVFFGVLGFYGEMKIDELLLLITSTAGLTMLIQIISLPVAIRVAKKLKTIEAIDIYDTNTKWLSQNNLSFL